MVARAIQDQMLGRNESHVLLDISHKPAGKVRIAPSPVSSSSCAALVLDLAALLWCINVTSAP